MDDVHLFANRYRIPSARLRGWDYADPGSYFITICTKGRIEWFGEIIDETVRLSDVGWVVDDEWKKTAIIRPYVTLDEYVIMPDHFHGIIDIHEHAGNTTPVVETPWQGVSTDQKHRQWQPGSLGAIMNQFKRACTKRIRDIAPDFTWQPRFHDHRIRNDDERNRIRTYIRMNPHQGFPRRMVIAPDIVVS